MGRINTGILGPFTGNVGTVVGSSWKGIPYIKARPVRKKAAGPAEMANRNKFAMAQNWLQPVTGFVRQGFKNYTLRVEGFLAAKSWMLRNSFEGTGEELSINPALVKLSHGTLPLSNHIRVEKKNVDEFHFSWDTDLTENNHGKDQVMVLAYDIDHQYAVMLTTGQFREIGKDKLTVDRLKGKNYHVYLAFVSADRNDQSDSVYLGKITNGDD